MPWLLTVVLLVSLFVIVMVKLPTLRSRRQPLPRVYALGGAIAGLSPLVGMISQRYLHGSAHYFGLALQGMMIGSALCMIWIGARKTGSSQ
ncbi:MAG: hypothetical protein ACM3ZQ_02110 [Bacillota bacterium]